MPPNKEQSEKATAKYEASFPAKELRTEDCMDCRIRAISIRYAIKTGAKIIKANPNKNILAEDAGSEISPQTRDSAVAATAITNREMRFQSKPCLAMQAL